MKRIALLLVVCALLLGTGSRLHAQILNGSFTTGDLTDWTQVGSVTVLTSSSPTPPSGTTEAMITSTDGTPADSATISTLDTQLNLTLPPTYDTTPAAFSGPGPFNPENGQAIYQTFTLTASATLSFAYSFQSTDNYPFDSAGYTLSEGTGPATYTELARPNDPLNPGPTMPTPFTTVNLTLNAGTYTLGFVSYNTSTAGLYSTSDTYGPSTLYVTNVSTESAPEPSAWGLLLLSALGLMVVRTVRSRFSPSRVRA